MNKLNSPIWLSLLLMLSLASASSAQSNDAKSNLSIIQGMYANFAKGEIPAVLAMLDPKVEWNEAENMIYGNNKPIIGPDAVGALFVTIGGEWENFTIANLQVNNLDNGMVLATGRYQAKYKKNGAPLDAQVAHLFTLKDGKVVKFQQYTDTKQFAEVIKK